MENINQIMSRVLSGEATSDEHATFEKWLAADAKNQVGFERIKSYWSANIRQTDAVPADAAWKRMQQRIHANDAQSGKVIPMQSSRRKWLAVAASIAILVVLSLSYIFMQQPSEKYYTLQAEASRQEFTLDDGTKVTLNKDSRLKYSSEYGKKTRTVELEGEGFFEVAKDAAHPFEVKMGDAQISVLGTVFTVKSDAEANEIIASLLEGSIRFDSPSGKIMIKPDQQIVYSRATHHTEVRETSAEDDAAWRSGQFRYRSVSFATLINDLERNYQVDIEMQNENLKKSSVVVTATFNEKQTLPEIFEIINRTLPIQWAGADGHYTIK